jgi:hypothetical protein
MKPFRWYGPRWRSFTAAAFFAVMIPRLAHAQQLEGGQRPILLEYGKTEIFRHFLYQADIQPLYAVGDVQTAPRNTIIVLLGKKSIDFCLNEQVIAAVDAGASILIASDKRPDRNELTNVFGVEIIGNLVTANVEDCYLGIPERPFVRTIRFGFDNDEDSPRAVFKNLEWLGETALATNNASVIRIRSKMKAIAAAAYPFSARAAFPNRRPVELDFNKDLFAAGGHYGEGRFLVLGDHSVFVNGMVWKPDNGNMPFLTDDCIPWLQSPGKRSRCLFVEDGVIQTEFGLPTEEMDLLKRLLMIRHVINTRGNQITEDLESKNALNEFALNRFPLRKIIAVVVTVCAVLLAFYCFGMMVGRASRADPARTLVTPELAALIPRGNVLQQRFDGQLESGSIYEAARRLVREYFAGLDAEPDENGRRPQIEIVDGYENERALRRRIASLWAIGYGSTPIRIPMENWTRVGRALEDVLQDFDDGWWRFRREESLTN